MPRRTLPAAALILLLASVSAPPPTLAADAPLPHPSSVPWNAPGEIWSSIRSFFAFLGHEMDPNGTQSADSGHGMDPDGRDGLDSGHGMDPNG